MAYDLNCIYIFLSFNEHVKAIYQNKFWKMNKKVLVLILFSSKDRLGQFQNFNSLCQTSLNDNAILKMV